MKKPDFFLLSLLLLFSFPAFAQLEPGFSPKEYRDFLGITASGIKDTTFIKGIPQSPEFEKVYESPMVGLENKWSLYVNKNEKVAWLTIRGTVSNTVSWLANFYAAMIPAQGSMKISDEYEFEYKFSTDPKAAVHVGWTLATGALAQTLVPKVDSLYQTGYRDFIVAGHSQGGAISYLMTSHLNSLREDGRWKEPIRIKTYASAAPKPGNLYFAYQYEYKTQGGWAFNVVNGADWVPETPFSIQTIEDFNTVNPFTDASDFIKKQKFPQKLVFRKVYNKLDKPTKKSVKNFQKYLGKLAGKQVKKNLPEYQTPAFFDSNNYSRTGSFIILLPDEGYWEKFPNEQEKVFKHHGLIPYFYLLEKQFPNTTLGVKSPGFDLQSSYFTNP